MRLVLGMRLVKGPQLIWHTVTWSLGGLISIHCTLNSIQYDDTTLRAKQHRKIMRKLRESLRLAKSQDLNKNRTKDEPCGVYRGIYTLHKHAGWKFSLSIGLDWSPTKRVFLIEDCWKPMQTLCAYNWKPRPHRQLLYISLLARHNSIISYIKKA